MVSRTVFRSAHLGPSTPLPHRSNSTCWTAASTSTQGVATPRRTVQSTIHTGNADAVSSSTDNHPPSSRSYSSTPNLTLTPIAKSHQLPIVNTPTDRFSPNISAIMVGDLFRVHHRLPFPPRPSPRTTSYAILKINAHHHLGGGGRANNRLQRHYGEGTIVFVSITDFSPIRGSTNIPLPTPPSTCAIKHRVRSAPQSWRSGSSGRGGRLFFFSR